MLVVATALSIVSGYLYIAAAWPILVGTRPGLRERRHDSGYLISRFSIWRIAIVMEIAKNARR